MSSSAIKRIQKELAELNKSPIENITISPITDDDLFKWAGHIHGPESSPFSGYSFKLTIEFAQDYPFKPPMIKFATKIYHPNVDDDGSICLQVLKTEQWKPATKLGSVLANLVLLLSEPNPDDPLRSNIANEFKTDNDLYVKNAVDWCKKYAEKKKA